MNPVQYIDYSPEQLLRIVFLDLSGISELAFGLIQTKFGDSLEKLELYKRIATYSKNEEFQKLSIENILNHITNPPKHSNHNCGIDVLWEVANSNDNEFGLNAFQKVYSYQKIALRRLRPVANELCYCKDNLSFDSKVQEVYNSILTRINSLVSNITSEEYLEFVCQNKSLFATVNPNNIHQSLADVMGTKLINKDRVFYDSVGLILNFTPKTIDLLEKIALNVPKYSNYISQQFASNPVYQNTISLSIQLDSAGIQV